MQICDKCANLLIVSSLSVDLALLHKSFPLLFEHQIRGFPSTWAGMLFDDPEFPWEEYILFRQQPIVSNASRHSVLLMHGFTNRSGASAMILVAVFRSMKIVCATTYNT